MNKVLSLTLPLAGLFLITPTARLALYEWRAPDSVRPPVRADPPKLDPAALRAVSEVPLAPSAQYEQGGLLEVLQDSTMSGAWCVGSFVVRKGVTIRVVGDLTIHARGSMDIAGSIAADARQGPGISIELRSNGPVRISGNILAGDCLPNTKGPSGSRAPDGGNLRLEAAVTWLGGHMVGGRGADGAPGQAGGNGGDVIATGPTYRLAPDGPSELIGGDGGHGGHGIPGELDGHGGSGGAGGSGGSGMVFGSIEEAVAQGLRGPRHQVAAHHNAFDGNSILLPSGPAAFLPPGECEDNQGDQPDQPGDRDDVQGQERGAGGGGQQALPCIDGVDGSVGTNATGGSGGNGGNGGPPTANPGNGGHGAHGGTGGKGIGGTGGRGQNGGECCAPQSGTGGTGGTGGKGGGGLGGGGGNGGKGADGTGGCNGGNGGNAGNGGIGQAGLRGSGRNGAKGTTGNGSGGQVGTDGGKEGGDKGLRGWGGYPNGLRGAEGNEGGTENATGAASPGFGPTVECD